MVIKIKTTFATVTPESAEEGELSDQGWLDEEGSEFEDIDEVVSFLKDEGAMEPSSSCPHIGVWYATEFQTEDIATGEQIQKSFHIDGASPEEEYEIYQRLFPDEIKSCKFRRQMTEWKWLGKWWY